MQRSMICKTVAGALGLVMTLGLGGAADAQTKPDKTQGVAMLAAQVLSMGAQIPQTEGLELRMRRIAIEPGGVLAHHSHGGRPTAVFVIAGELTEHRDGLAPIVRKAGDGWVEGKDVSHWIENRGTGAVVVITADVVPVK